MISHAHQSPKSHKVSFNHFSLFNRHSVTQTLRFLCVVFFSALDILAFQKVYFTIAFAHFTITFTANKIFVIIYHTLPTFILRDNFLCFFAYLFNNSTD
jgi:hypothetical protein